MTIRLTALYIYVAILLVYAWKDWFKSLCGLILMMAVMRHESMPTTMFGIQGFNMWNVLLLGVFLAWIANRRREGFRWDMPRYITVLLLMYLGVIVVGFLRAALDRSYIEEYPLSSLVSEELINTIKWVLPGILLFDGCRTRRRVMMALICLLGVYLLISVQVINRMPLESVLGGRAGIERTRLRVCGEIGYSACDMSAFFAGASWATLAAHPLVRQKKYKVLVLAAAGIVTFGQAMTGGRAGYLAWGATGLVLCLLKWRKYLILAPVVVMLVPIVFPAVNARIWQGFGEIDVTGQTTVDLEEGVTSGRMIFWPHIVDKIVESPWVGYGRLATQRTGLREYLRAEYDESQTVGHPHNMYLETLLDNGILGSIPILLFFALMIVYSGKLFRSDDGLCSAVGGPALSLMLAQLFAGIGAQHFYPLESTVGMWTGMFLAIRVYVERRRVQMDVVPAENSWSRSNPRFSQQVAISSVHTCGLL